MMNVNVNGALINGALYLVCAFVAGVVTNHGYAWKFALAAMGITFFCHVAAIYQRAPLSVYLMYISWLFGAASAAALIF
jgi:hypothetical protein